MHLGLPARGGGGQRQHLRLTLRATASVGWGVHRLDEVVRTCEPRIESAEAEEHAHEARVFWAVDMLASARDLQRRRALAESQGHSQRRAVDG
jgi:hypothetical protein